MITPTRYTFSGRSMTGGMGEVYICKDEHLHRDVIVKTLKTGEDNRRLLDEQKALLQLRSKHVVQLYDIIEILEEKEKRKALVLEYIDGEELKPNSLDLDKNYLTILWQIACGLSEIHAAGIIHRDIKPSNIKLNGSQTIKILDFGLSRNSGPDAHTMSAIGTPIFMAPELWKKTKVSFEQSIDIYAFAVTALCLIKEPSTPVELSKFPPQPLKAGHLKKVLRGAPNEIVQLLERCLDHTPTSRPKSKEIELTFRKYLLKGKHRALLVAAGKTYELHEKSLNANISIESLGSITVSYDGIGFKITSKTGHITVNNKICKEGDELPECCVITFGITSRRFITFDVSNPEVLP